MSEWDILWNLQPTYSTSSGWVRDHVKQRELEPWLEKIKTEGNKLQAENLFFRRQFTKENADLVERVVKLESTHEKLEAIRGIIESKEEPDYWKVANVKAVLGE